MSPWQQQKCLLRLGNAFPAQALGIELALCYIGYASESRQAWIIFYLFNIVFIWHLFKIFHSPETFRFLFFNCMLYSTMLLLIPTIMCGEFKTTTNIFYQFSTILVCFSKMFQQKKKIIIILYIYIVFDCKVILFFYSVPFSYPVNPVILFLFFPPLPLPPQFFLFRIFSFSLLIILISQEIPHGSTFRHFFCLLCFLLHMLVSADSHAPIKISGKKSFFSGHGGLGQALALRPRQLCLWFIVTHSWEGTSPRAEDQVEHLRQTFSRQPFMSCNKSSSWLREQEELVSGTEVSQHRGLFNILAKDRNSLTSFFFYIYSN